MGCVMKLKDWELEGVGTVRNRREEEVGLGVRELNKAAGGSVYHLECAVFFFGSGFGPLDFCFRSQDSDREICDKSIIIRACRECDTTRFAKIAGERVRIRDFIW